jgi:hypothetical protein
MHKRSIWFTLVAAVLLLAMFLYLNREFLLRVAVAYRAYRANIFTPLPPIPGESRFRRLRSDAQFYWDFSEIPMARQKRLQRVNPVLRPLIKQMNRAQATGQDMEYSMNIYREIRWLLNFTPDLKGVWTEVDAFRKSLSQPERQKLAAEQQPDGSWALGINSWYLKLYYSVESGSIQECVPPPRYPLQFLDRINSPEKLTAELDSALHDDFTRTGIFNRERTDETFSALARLLIKGKPIRCYIFHPELAQTLRAFVNRWQNPVTGCWGQWLIDRQGRTWKMDDMAMTFHVVSDLKGQVQHLDQIANRLLQLYNMEFPTGNRFNGHHENHLNADAVIILHYAWPTLDAATRERASQQISQMLTWCLAESLQPDGSFKVSELDDTTSDAQWYGVWFLDEAGYFNRRKRFWTEQDFPNAQAIRARIAANLKATGLSDPGLKSAYKMVTTAE